MRAEGRVHVSHSNDSASSMSRVEALSIENTRSLRQLSRPSAKLLCERCMPLDASCRTRPRAVLYVACCEAPGGHCEDPMCLCVRVHVRVCCVLCGRVCVGACLRDA
jgi:hypothetical protein